MLVPLINAAELRDQLSPEVYVAVFDDMNTGDLSAIDQSGPVKLVLRDANALVVSGLPPMYNTVPDGSDPTIPALLQTAIGLYIRYFTWLRRPEYTRVTGRDESNLLDHAEKVMDRIRAGLLQFAPKDNPPEPSPENVGGQVNDGKQRVFLEGPNGEVNSGDF